MQTFREAISDIREELKALNVDERYSNRFLYNKLINQATLFISQDAENRRLFKEHEFIKPIPCFDMEEVYGDNCGVEFFRFSTVSKSKIPLPETYPTLFGSIIKIFNEDESKEYVIVPVGSYRDYINRRIKTPHVSYCWVKDKYLYIPNIFIQSVKLSGAFVSLPSDKTKLNAPLDNIFNVPGKLLKIIKQEIVKELAQINKQIQEDQTPNMRVKD